MTTKNIIYTILCGALAVVVYLKWGLKGSAVLIAGYGVIYVTAYFVVLRNERKIMEMLQGRSMKQIDELLAQLDPTSREEVNRVRRKYLKQRMDELKKKREREA